MLSAQITYGYDQPLGTINQDFLPGRMYGISGANGAGKSTLLKTLATELDPISGTVSLDDGDAETRSRKGDIVLIGDTPFYPDLSVGEHLKLLEKADSLDFSDAVEQWDLANLLDSPPSSLSSGQRQRVSLAAQLGYAVPVLLLDEPERHLDSYWVSELIAELHRHREADSVILVASHSSTVLDACDEIVVIE